MAVSHLLPCPNNPLLEIHICLINRPINPSKLAQNNPRMTPKHPLNDPQTTPQRRPYIYIYMVSPFGLSWGAAAPQTPRDPGGCSPPDPPRPGGLRLPDSPEPLGAFWV